MRETAVTTERLRLARDLHDGVLQTLTGAALQLQTARRLMTVDPRAAEDRLSQVQRIIAAGQNDLRFFIQQLGPRRSTESSGPVDLNGRVGELADRVRRQWGVPVTRGDRTGASAGARPAGERCVPADSRGAGQRRAARQGVVAPTGAAARAATALDRGGRRRAGVSVQGRFTLEDLARDQRGPRTLRERVTALGGSMVLETGPGGSRVRLVVPLDGEAA